MPRAAQQPNLTTSTISVSSTTISSTPGLRASKRIRESSTATSALTGGAATPTPRKRTRASLAPAVGTPASSVNGGGEGSSAKKMRTTKTSDGEDLWSEELDRVLKEGLALIPYMGKRTVYFDGDDESYGRNGLLAEYLRRQTGKLRNRVQIASHCAVWKKNNKHDQELAALIKGHEVPASTLSTIDYSALLGPDLHPETLTPARAQSKAKRMKAFGLEDSADEEEEDGDEEDASPAKGKGKKTAAAKGKGKKDAAEKDDLSSDLSSAEDDEEEEMKGTRRGRPRPPTSASKLPTVSRARLPRVASRSSLAPSSSAVDAATTTDDDEKPKSQAQSQRKGRKSLLPTDTPRRRSTRHSLAPSASAATTDVDVSDAETSSGKGKGKKEEEKEDDVPPVPALPASIADAAAPSTSFATTSASAGPAEEEDVQMADAPATKEEDKEEEKQKTTEVLPAPGQLNLARVSSAHSEAEVERERERQQEGHGGEGGGWLSGIRRGFWRALGY